MKMTPGGPKMKLLTVMRIFERETDKSHPLTANQVCEKLGQYIHIDANRKGVYDDIEALNMFYEAFGDKRKKVRKIVPADKGRGYYLDNRPFSSADVRLMIDAIEASKYLSEAKTRELIEALEELCPQEQRRQIKSQVVIFDRVKNMNIDIHDSLDKIGAAIAQNKQIQFRYFDYDVNKRRAYRKKGSFYQVSPYEMIYTDDSYYLIAYNAERKARNTYRIDRMALVNILPLDREGRDEMEDARKDKPRLQKSTFSMFDGKIETVTMVFRISMMNAVLDRFGSDVFVIPVDKEHFKINVPVAISQQFYGWLFGLGNYVTITHPEHIKREFAEKLEEIRKRYE